MFDEETGLYYLRSRYYNPRWGRFVNADECFDNGAGLLAANLFAYCANSAVAFKDTNGRGLVLACVIAFGVIGAVLGGCYGAAKSEEELGYVDAGWVAGGAIIGGAAGAVIGWGVGTVASSVMASQIIGQLGPPTYASWQQAEASLRQTMNCFLDQAERTLWTPYGNRIVDAWNTCERVIGEAKYGYTCLTRFIELQIEKDVWLLENGVVQAVEWHFYASQVTGQGGASQPLIDALLEAGFTVFLSLTARRKIMAILMNRLERALRYEPLVPPINKPICTFTEDETKCFFDWYMQNIPNRIKYLAQQCRLPAYINSESYEWKTEHLLTIWKWFYKSVVIQCDPITGKKKLSVMSEYMLRDIGMYMGEMFVSVFPNLHWGYYTQPKSDFFVNQPTIFGFVDYTFEPPFHFRFEPIHLVGVRGAKILRGKFVKTDLYDFFQYWAKYADYKVTDTAERSEI